MDIRKLQRAIVDGLEDVKGQNIVVLNTEHLSPLFERVIRRNGPTYTLDTMQALRAAHPAARWFIVIGQDQYARLHTWRDWRDLLARVTLAVAAREGEKPAAGAEVAEHAHRLVELPLPAMPVSASDVRRRVARGERIADMVPPAVAGYIDRTHLYRS